MKKINYFFTLLFVACVVSSCSIGSYVPSTLNIGGVSTQVVLSQANFRVVRNIETVVDINNYNLRRADVEKSAFAELTRKYPLTGSQAYINVVLEEVRRESYTSLKQHVAIRATIIEFLQENGQPVQSNESPYNTILQRTTQPEVKKTEEKNQIVASNEELINSEKIAQMAKAKKNQYYIMCLFKTNNFNYNNQSEAEKYFNIQNLQKEKTKYTLKELQKLSEGYDKYFEKFARIL